jgi:hypothetical protein
MSYMIIYPSAQLAQGLTLYLLRNAGALDMEKPVC